MKNKPVAGPARARQMPDLEFRMLQQRLQNAPVWHAAGQSSFASASVMLLLYQKDHEPWLLAVLKTDTRGYPWRNQVALPGGHAEPQDSSALDTALREVKEELGINPDRISVIGSLGQFFTIRQTIIEVFLGLWEGDPEGLHFDSTEISRVLEIPVASLHHIHETCGFSGRDPDISELLYPYDDVTIWGVTARMVHFLLEHII